MVTRGVLTVEDPLEKKIVSFAGTIKSFWVVPETADRVGPVVVGLRKPAVVDWVDP